MKVRNGFVSNSSSTSFVISKMQLTKTQVSMIINHIDVCQTLEEECSADITDEYNIIENDGFISGDTIMDNFGMSEFLEKIVEVDRDYVHWLNECVIGLSHQDILNKDKKTTSKKRKEKLEKIDKDLR